MTTNQLEEKWIKLNGYAEDFQPSAAESKRIADFGMGYRLAMQDYGLANRSKDTGFMSDKPTPNTEWETYCDESYYHLWRLRRKNERGFDDGYHLRSGEEAKDLCAYLNQLERDLAEARAQAERLADAAGAVIARWDTPKWKDAEPTAKVISRMRKELAAYRAAKGEGVVE
jgi:hypothetical protein